MLVDPAVPTDHLTVSAKVAAIVSSIAAVCSLALNLYQFIKKKNLTEFTNGFIHALKPTIESAKNGDSFSASYWDSVLVQLHDLMSRVQPAKKNWIFWR